MIALPLAPSDLHLERRSALGRILDNGATWLVLAWLLLFVWLVVVPEGRKALRRVAERMRIAANARRARRG